jgi:hypothetical protein
LRKALRPSHYFYGISGRGFAYGKTPKLSGVRRTARREPGLKLVPESGTPDDPANKEFRIWGQVVGPGEAIPQGPEDLHSSFSTERKKEMMDFGPESGGETVYFAAQIENGKLKGPWGAADPGAYPAEKEERENHQRHEPHEQKSPLNVSFVRVRLVRGDYTL